jgi:hypothetical protein
MAKGEIHYSCDEGTCTADDLHKKCSKSTDLTMTANGTDVNLRFTRSPFVTGEKVIPITAGNHVTKKLVGTPGTFSYSIGCASCTDVHDDADLIIGL